MTLLGMRIEEACEAIKELGYEYECIPYKGSKPYETADDNRVVRIKLVYERKYQLIYCSFITFPQNDSQG